MIKTKSFVLLSALLLVVLLNVSAGQADYFVDSKSTQSSSDCGSTPSLACPCLADVLNLSHLGSSLGPVVINIAAGTYSGPRNIGLTVNIANLQIKGSDPSSVIIDLGGSPTFLTITVPGVVVVNLTIKNGITANADLAVINVKLTVGGTLSALLNSIKFNDVNFVNIQGTAILCADLNVLNGLIDLKLNANVFVVVILTDCSFVNVTVDPVVRVDGRISLKLVNVDFNNCGSPDLNGAVVLALHQSTVVCIGVTIQNCRGASLLDLSAAASVNLAGALTVKANVVSVSLLNLDVKLGITILSGLSVDIDANTAPADCTNVKCSSNVPHLAALCPSCGNVVNLDLGSFF